MEWRELVRPFAVADDRKAVVQLSTTFALYVATLAVMGWSLRFPYVVTLALAPLAGGAMIRLFVLFHDCCHLSLFRSPRVNEWVGMLLGPFVLTSYFQWRLEHSIHHATAGNVDKRGIGDIPTFLRSEYEAAPWWKRAGYRLLRHPLSLLTVLATATFVLVHRFFGPVGGRREKLGVIATDVAVVAIVSVAVSVFGAMPVVLVMAPTIVIGAAGGIWLFYVQHQIPDAYWRREDAWDFRDAALLGSTFYDLPAPLRYFSASIGYHHIHHLCPKIPNHRLRACHEASPALQVPPLTIRASFACALVNLIEDETLRSGSFSRSNDSVKMKAPVPCAEQETASRAAE